MKTKDRPPNHLSGDSKKWWLEVIGGYELEEHHRKLLTGCCEALDRAAEARRAVARDGAYQKNRFNDLVKHPGVGVERDAMTTFARLLRELDLDVEPPSEARRPAQLRSIRGGR